MTAAAQRPKIRDSMAKLLAPSTHSKHGNRSIGSASYAENLSISPLSLASFSLRCLALAASASVGSSPTTYPPTTMATIAPASTMVASIGHGYGVGVVGVGAAGGAGNTPNGAGALPARALNVEKKRLRSSSRDLAFARHDLTQIVSPLRWFTPWRCLYTRNTSRMRAL
jgi:hypothetical protein